MIIKCCKILSLALATCLLVNSNLVFAATASSDSTVTKTVTSTATQQTSAAQPATQTPAAVGAKAMQAAKSQTAATTTTTTTISTTQPEQEVSAADREKIQQAITKVIPGFQLHKIMLSPVTGFYQIITGADVIYVSRDAQYIFYGNLLDLNRDKKDWNLTEKLRNGIRKDMLSAINKNDMIIFSPKDTVKGTVVVFTDVDCVYCRRFHQNIKAILDLGIEVRYLAFPRQGVDSDDYKKMVSIWCADNKAEMLTLAKSGGTVPEKQCTDSKVAAQFKLGEQMGVRGTPTLVFADGFMLASTLDPKDLMQQILEHTAK